MPVSPRRKKNGDDGPDYTPEEVDELTNRAAVLLDELHGVLGEMSRRLHALREDEESS